MQNALEVIHRETTTLPPSKADAGGKYTFQHLAGGARILDGTITLKSNQPRIMTRCEIFEYFQLNGEDIVIRTTNGFTHDSEFTHGSRIFFNYAQKTFFHHELEVSKSLLPWNKPEPIAPMLLDNKTRRLAIQDIPEQEMEWSDFVTMDAMPLHFRCWHDLNYIHSSAKRASKTLQAATTYLQKVKELIEEGKVQPIIIDDPDFDLAEALQEAAENAITTTGKMKPLYKRKQPVLGVQHWVPGQN